MLKRNSAGLLKILKNDDDFYNELKLRAAAEQPSENMATAIRSAIHEAMVIDGFVSWEGKTNSTRICGP